MRGMGSFVTDRKRYKFTAPTVRPIIPNTKSRHWYIRLYRMLTRKVMYEVTEDYYCYIPFLDITLFIPKGFVFDGASIPKWLWPILAPIDVLLITAVFHDFAYRYNTYLTADKELYLTNLDRATYDIVFRKLSYATNGLHITSWASFLMLRIFGRAPWNQSREDNRKIRKDFPELAPLHPYVTTIN